MAETGDATTRAEVAARLVDRLDDVAARMIERIVAEIPAYDVLDADQLADVRRIAVWATGRLLAAWSEGRQIAAEDVATFRRIGAARALDGRPLPAVLRSYRLGGVHLWRLIAEEGGERLAMADALAWTELWLHTIDDVSEAIHEGYSGATDRLATDRERARAALLDDILRGRHARAGGLREHAQLLGVELPERPTLLVATGVGADRVTVAALTALLDEAGAPAASRLVREGADGGSALVAAGREAELRVAVGRRGWRAVVLHQRDVGALPRAYRLAVDALTQAPARAFGTDGCLDAGDAELLALLHATPEAAPDRLVAEVLGPLLGPGEDRLVAGLAAYLSAGSAQGAARALAVHEQTVRYRLRRVTALTGRDPRRPWNRFVFESALAVRRR